MSAHDRDRRLVVQSVICAMEAFIDARINYDRNPCINYSNDADDKADALADALVDMLHGASTEIKDDVTSGFTNAFKRLSSTL